MRPFTPDGAPSASGSCACSAAQARVAEHARASSSTARIARAPRPSSAATPGSSGRPPTLAEKRLVRAPHLVRRRLARQAEHLEVVALLDQRVARQDRARAPSSGALATTPSCAGSTFFVVSPAKSALGDSSAGAAARQSASRRHSHLRSVCDRSGDGLPTGFATLGAIARAASSSASRSASIPAPSSAKSALASPAARAGAIGAPPSAAATSGLSVLPAGRAGCGPLFGAAHGDRQRRRPVRSPSPSAPGRGCCPCAGAAHQGAGVRMARARSSSSSGAIGRTKKPSARSRIRASSAASPTRKIGTRPRGTARTLASASAGSAWTICGAMTISSGREAVIQPEQALARLDRHRLEPRRQGRLADPIRLVGPRDDEQLHQTPPNLPDLPDAVPPAGALRGRSGGRRPRRGAGRSRSSAVRAAARAAAASGARSCDDSQTCQRARPRSRPSGASAGPLTRTAAPPALAAATAAAVAPSFACAGSRASSRSAIMRVKGG